MEPCATRAYHPCSASRSAMPMTARHGRRSLRPTPRPEQQASADAVLAAFDPATVGVQLLPQKAERQTSYRHIRALVAYIYKVTHGGRNPSANNSPPTSRRFGESFETCDPVVDRRFHERRRSITSGPLRWR
jgi:hypothetical protein